MPSISTGRTLVLAAALAAFAGCAAHPVHGPSADAAKGVRVLEQADPSTLISYGHVTAEVTVRAADLADAEALVLDQLARQALREHPETTVLYEVSLIPDTSGYEWNASGIAARRKGS